MLDAASHAGWLTDVFAHLCGQGRCFVIDGEPLPVCQRCLGLYAGASVAAVWLAAPGALRVGPPGRPVVLLHSLMLLVAMAGGLHWIDAGPRWRLLCGLWTGHVAVLWLAMASAQLTRSVRDAPPAGIERNRRRDRQLVALAAGLAGAAALFHQLALLGWSFWAGAAATGAIAVGAAGLAAVAAVLVAVGRVLRAVHRGIHGVGVGGYDVSARRPSPPQLSPVSAVETFEP